MTHEISALVFDAYGTLFDVHSVTRRAEALFPGQGAALSAAWRTKQLEYSWLRTLMDRYEDFNQVTRSALEWSLASLGITAGDEARRALLDEYRRLSAFPDVPAALAALAAQRPLAILSNGHPEMLDAVVDHSGLRGHFRGGVLSVHPAARFKPDPAVYRLAEDRLGMPCRRPIAATIIGRAQMRPALDHLARNSDVRLTRIVAALFAAAARVFGNAAGFRRIGHMLRRIPV